MRDSMNGMLIGHWPLSHDALDHGPHALNSTATGITFSAGGPGEGTRAARFDGRESVIEVAHHPALDLSTADFSLSMWIDSDRETYDIVGDLVSQFDPESRRGFNLAIVTNGGVTSTATANYRQLHFGIDNGHIDETWQDCGRPGEACHITALATVGGYLYAGTMELAAGGYGRLWRYGGGQKWTDLGNPVGCNAVQGIAEYRGEMYAALGRYNSGGSLLGHAGNQIPGGQIYRYSDDAGWEYCGHPGHEDATPEETDTRGAMNTGKADNAIALTVCAGELFCTSRYRTGVFRYDGGTEWRNVGMDSRLMSLAVYREKLYALLNGGAVYRYDGPDSWVHCGHPAGSTQTYSAVVHDGKFYVGTWPNCEVFRFDGCDQWQSVGKLGYGKEVMGMALYNGKVYAGELPMANVFRMDGDKGFTMVGNLDNSPVALRRVWSMATYNGRLYAGTLPSGHVLSIEVGKMVTWDHAFPSGWHHVAAVKSGSELSLYVDGTRVAQSDRFHESDYDITNSLPLRIGAGAHDYFSGQMCDVRLYGCALDPSDVSSLFAGHAGDAP